MTTEELYGRIGGDYADVMGRLGMDLLVSRFIIKFVDDTSCNDLFNAWEAGDERAAFDAAHRAKGVCANLSLTSLQNLSSDICEALREGNESLRASTDVDALVRELQATHADTLEQIKEFAGR